jgi:hypothetical protein
MDRVQLRVEGFRLEYLRNKGLGKLETGLRRQELRVHSGLESQGLRVFGLGFMVRIQDTGFRIALR